MASRQAWQGGPPRRRWSARCAVRKRRRKRSARCTPARPFVIPNPWDAGSARVLAGARVPGARHDQLGVRVHARAAGRRRHARRGRRARGGARPRRRTCRSRSTSRTATAPSPQRRRARDRARGRGRRGRWLDRGLRPGRRASTSRSHAAERIAAAARGRAEPRRSRSCSPRGPRTTSAATPTSTTRSRASRPTRRPAPTSSTRRVWRTVEEIRAVCDAVSKPVNVLARPDLSRRARSPRRARSASASAAALTWVAVDAMADAATAIRDAGDLSLLAADDPFDRWLADPR